VLGGSDRRRVVVVRGKPHRVTAVLFLVFAIVLLMGTSGAMDADRRQGDMGSAWLLGFCAALALAFLVRVVAWLPAMWSGGRVLSVERRGSRMPTLVSWSEIDDVAVRRIGSTDDIRPGPQLCPALTRFGPRAEWSGGDIETSYRDGPGALDVDGVPGWSPVRAEPGTTMIVVALRPDSRSQTAVLGGRADRIRGVERFARDRMDTAVAAELDALLLRIQDWQQTWSHRVQPFGRARHGGVHSSCP